MSTRFHRRIKTSSTGRINVSKKGASYSEKIGPFTFNSRGTVTYNSSIKGLSFKMPILAWFAFIPLYYSVKLLWWTLKLPFILLNKLFKFIKTRKNA